MSPEDKVKIKDTVRYSMSQDPEQDLEEVTDRCIPAIIAERYVADHLDGYINHGGENLKDPYTYAYDVLAHPKYSGLRVEVKTSMLNPERIGQKQWVGCTTGQFGRYPGGYGINLGPFIEFSVSDVIIIFRVEKMGPGAYRLIPYVLADKMAFKKEAGLVAKSNFTGWYISGRVDWGWEDSCACKVFTTSD
ncbi:DenB-like DNA endonuclease IV [Escherichia phage EcS1]|uniref:Endonuclease IV n=1 Tax=Escherichia phage EcS1 TaxID=2083276 RepID=A0A2Z5ZCF7_9CAUD|nr:DenB-like DNA endonuclease IV [Escherichia phage EcS1]BBC78340.1 Endonuclease IV [Escherichia phage EcS1]